MKNINGKIAGRIVAFYTGNASQADRRWLEEWVKSDSRNEELLADCLRLCNYVKLSEKDASEGVIKQRLGQAKYRRPGSLRRRIAIAASAAAAVVAGYFIVQIVSDGRTRGMVAQEITPGTTKALFVSGDTTIELDRSMDIKTDDGIQLIASTGDTLFTVDKAVMAQHKLIVPRGGEYNFTMADGTRVWLNSGSEFVFPDQFADNIRRVELVGEGYFEVAHDASKPFKVSLSAGEIVVYGTSFNVANYAGEHISAVLVEGSIGFVPSHGEGEGVRLAQSERMIYDIATGDISIERVNTSSHIAWTRNMFIFDGQRLDAIMATLARWYDVDVVFESGELKNITLSGQFSRDQDLGMLMDVYGEIASLDFTIRGKTIMVGKKR